ncbi:MAG: Beta-galactosidase C-terminal domain [Candidatus Ornithomonoglobus sp.]
MIRKRADYTFVMNFSTEERIVKLNGENILMRGYSYRILKSI